MSAIGFTTSTSKIKEQSDLANTKGLEAFGVSLIDDADGKHDVIKASNAQMHLFMQIKKGNVQCILFQEPEHVGIFLDNITAYFGEEKAKKYLDSMKFVCIEGCEGEMESRRIESQGSFSQMEEALDSLN